MCAFLAPLSGTSSLCSVRSQLEKRAEDNLGNSENISDSHWFEKENVGNAEHYGLRSVTEPKRYLSIQIKRKRCIFVLSKALKECVQVQDKKIEQRYVFILLTKLFCVVFLFSHFLLILPALKIFFSLKTEYIITVRE